MKRVLTLILTAGTVAIFSANAFAQQPVEYNVTVKADVVKGSPNDHYLTFTTPVEIPDATLPAGTYVFTLIGTSVVQVTSVDRTQQLAMFFTSPLRRFDSSDNHRMTMLPAAKDESRRITAWFRPNTELGLEFQYGAGETAGAR
jgi:hypothetical protein